jgi:hypothetical protein
MRIGDNYKPDDVIRKDDLVKVVNPHVFVKCGYDWNFKEARKEVFKKESKKISEICKRYDFSPRYSSDHRTVEDKIIDVLAHGLLSSRKRAGSKRKIFTEKCEDVKGQVLRVTDFFYKKTGFYSVDVEENCYGDNYYYNYLDKQKTHKILKAQKTSYPFFCYKIEAQNVYKLHKSKHWNVDCQCRGRMLGLYLKSIGVYNVDRGKIEDLIEEGCVKEWEPCDSYKSGKCDAVLEHLLIEEDCRDIRKKKQVL